MEQSIKSSEYKLPNALLKKNSNSAWLDAHTELIAKLESGYNTPLETDESSVDIRHYGFKIGGLNFLIAERMPSEVLEENTIYSIPLAPKWLIGTCNVRGEIVPVIDIEYVLSGNSRIVDTQKYKTFIIGKAEVSLGLLLNTLPIPIHFNKENRISTFKEFPKMLQPFITVGYKRNEEVWACIDFASFFSTLTSQQQI